MEKVALRPVLLRCVRLHALAEPEASVEEAVRRPAGIYGASPTCYLSAAVRLRGFHTRDMEDALWSRRSLVRIPAMRGSMYVLPRDLVPHGLAIARATSAARWLLPALRKGGLSEASIEKLVTRIEDLLHAGSKTTAELRKGLNGWKDPFPQALSLLLRYLSYEGRIVATRVRGSWRSQQYEYALLRDWMDLPRRFPSAEEALAKLAPLYFEANGPATLGNFAWWAGLKGAINKTVLGKLGLEPVSIEGLEDVHFATRTCLDELRAGSEVGSTNLIPFWDAYLMAQTNRRRYLDEKWANRVVDKNGNTTNVLLKDGRVAGIWDCVEDELRFASFEPVKLEAVRAAAEPLHGLLDFRKVSKVRIPRPLDEGGQNRFMSPLKESPNAVT